MGALDDVLSNLDKKSGTASTGTPSLLKQDSTQPSGSALDQVVNRLPAAPTGPVQGPGASPQMAVPDDVVSLPDRMALSLGNTQGSINYLKKKFDDVAVVPDKGIMVQQGGVWHQVNSALLGSGDAWEKTKEIVGAAPGPVINAISQTAGAIGGAAAGSVVPGVGTVAGEIAGAGVGGAVGSAITQSLGRLVGTFDATPEQSLKDIGTESLLAMGGQTVALGAKPLIGQMVQAAKVIGSRVSEAGGAALSEILGKTTNAGAPAIRTLLDDPSAVGSRISKYVQLGGNSETAQSLAASDLVSKTSDFLERSSKALPVKYGELMTDMLSKAEKTNMSVNFGNVVSDVGKSLEDKGLGTLIQDGKTLAFEPFSVEQQTARLQAGLPAENLGPELQKHMAAVVDRLTPYANLGEVNGKVAANQLVNMNKLLNELGSDAFKNNVPQVIKGGIAEMSSSFRNAIGKEFETAGLSNEYGNMSALYQQYGDAVQFARQTLNQQLGPEALARKLGSETGRNVTAKGQTALLTDLLNTVKDGSGTAALQDINATAAAKNLVPLFPHLSIYNAVAGTAAGTLALSKGGGAITEHPIAAVAGLAAGAISAPAFSPRGVARMAQGSQIAGDAASAAAESAVKYGSTTLNWLKSLSPQQLNEFLGSDVAITGFTQVVSTAVAKEQAMKNELVNRADAATQPHGMQIQQQGQQQPGQPQ